MSDVEKSRETLLAEQHALRRKVADLETTVARYKQVEDALRHSEEEYRSLFENASDAIFIVEMPTARILKTNEKAAELVRYTQEELCRLTVFDLDPPEDRPRVAAVIQQVLEEGSAIFEHCLVRKDGVEIPVEISTRLIDYEGGPALQSFIRDITERKQAEHEVARIKHFYEQILNDLPIQLAVLDLDFRYRYLNVRSITDPDFRQWLIGKTDLDYCRRRGVEPDLAHRRQAWYREVIAAGQSSSFEEILQTRAGEEKHFRRVANPTIGPDGEVTQLVGYGLDITEQKRAEAETKHLKEFYEDVLSSLTLQVAIFDLEGRFLYANPAGLSDPKMRRWIIGKTEADFMRKTGRPASLAQTRMTHLHRAVAERTLIIFEERFPTRSGETMVAMHSYCPMMDPDGEVTKVIGYRYDITERVQAEEERERLIEDFEAKNAELEQFTYTVMKVDHWEDRSGLYAQNGASRFACANPDDPPSSRRRRTHPHHF